MKRDEAITTIRDAEHLMRTAADYAAQGDLGMFEQYIMVASGLEELADRVDEALDILAPTPAGAPAAITKEAHSIWHGGSGVAPTPKSPPPPAPAGAPTVDTVTISRQSAKALYDYHQYATASKLAPDMLGAVLELGTIFTALPVPPAPAPGEDNTLNAAIRQIELDDMERQMETPAAGAAIPPDPVRAALEPLGWWLDTLLDCSPLHLGGCREYHHQLEDWEDPACSPAYLRFFSNRVEVRGPLTLVAPALQAAHTALTATVQPAPAAGAATPLTFEQLRHANVARQRAVWPDHETWTTTDWATAVAGEVGEACNLVKKRRRGDKIATLDIAYELADAVTYLDLWAWAMGIDLGEAVRDKFNLVSEMKQCAVQLGAGAATPDMWQRIKRALKDYRCQYTEIDDDGGGMPLVDKLTPPGDGCIERGQQEIELLTDTIWSELHPQSAATPGDVVPMWTEPCHKFPGGFYAYARTYSIRRAWGKTASIAKEALAEALASQGVATGDRQIGAHTVGRKGGPL